MSRRSLPCAVYTRKSTEEGLDQDFNSLDAQRAACSAYIRSQEGEGWREVKTGYDDGGYSGGSLERPALQRLLADIAAGKVKVVVVYKVDRLTRSLADFAKIIETLEAHDASFVSVTQQFSTTTSMGRLTLNVLLSFAQFEREVTAERIRDKIAASKKKGMWMGGVVPLGYDVIDRKLVVNKQEAETVRRLFELYRSHANTRIVKEEADWLGLRSKQRDNCSGKRTGGKPFTRGHINKILTNRLYIGEITHKGASYAGEHKPIVDRDLWDAVQVQLAKNAVKRRLQPSTVAPSLLTGLLETADGAALSPSHNNKRGRRYRYYVSRAQNGGAESGATWRLPALALEKIVIEGICAFLTDRQRLVLHLLDGCAASKLGNHFEAAAVLARDLRSRTASDQRTILCDIVRRIVLAEYQIGIEFREPALRSRMGMGVAASHHEITVHIPLKLRRRGVETKIIVESLTSCTEPDPNLVALVVNAHRWFEALKSGAAAAIQDLADREQIDRGDVSRILPLAFLAPDIVEAILRGRQPPELTAARLKRMRDLPLDWVHQRRYLGFA